MNNADKTIQSFRDQLTQTMDSKESSDAYDVARETQHPVAINFRTRTAERSFPYTYLQDFGLSEHGDIDLYFSTAQVTVKGRNLKPLYISLRRYRVAEIAVSANEQRVSSPKIEIDEIVINLHREPLS